MMNEANRFRPGCWAYTVNERSHATVINRGTSTRSLDRFENALRLLYGQSVSFDVEIEPSFQPRLRAFGRSLDFSQLPDGVRSTVGWIADFMMRHDLLHWDLTLSGKRPGVILLDEVDASLRPLWQRRLLPAMREALPKCRFLSLPIRPS